MMSDAPLTPDQVKAARGLLGWSQPDLSAQVYMSESAIRLFESGDKRLFHSTSTSSATPSKRPGVRLRKGIK
jgi:DNA-binding transcriptional regulator YiaG